MQALSLVLPDHMPLSPRCTHHKGYGELTYAVREVVAALPQHHFVLKTAVRSYYAAINHQLLLDHLAVCIGDREVLNLISRFLRWCAEWDGLYWDQRPLLVTAWVGTRPEPLAALENLSCKDSEHWSTEMTVWRFTPVALPPQTLRVLLFSRLACPKR